MSKIHDLVKDKHQKLFSIQDRWEDEKQYEDFGDYQKVVGEIFKEYGFSDVKLTKAFKISAKTSDGEKVTVKIFKSGKINIEEFE